MKTFGFVLAAAALVFAETAAPVTATPSAAPAPEAVATAPAPEAVAPQQAPAVAAPAPENAPAAAGNAAPQQAPAEAVATSPAPEAVAPQQAPAEASPATAENAPAPENAPAASPAEASPVAERPAEEPLPEEMPAPMAVRGVDPEAEPVYAEREPLPPREPRPAPVEPEVRKARVYRVQAEPVPMKFTFGAQGFIGTNTLYDSNWDFDESYSGIAWKAGLFAVIPLNDYTMGFRIGALYDYSDASASYFYGENYSQEAHVKFKMQRISVPMLFMLKSMYSTFSFDFGVQFSVPVVDNFKYSYDGSDGTPVNGNADMIDLDYRSSMDFALLLGLSIKANRYMSFDIRYECGFSNLYDSVPGWRINDLTSNTLLFGISFYAI